MDRATAFKELLECLRDNFYEQRNVYHNTPQLVWWCSVPLQESRVLYSYEDLILCIHNDGYFTICGTEFGELRDIRRFLDILKTRVGGEE